MKIVLGICTYRRPDELKKLLDALPNLHDIEDKHTLEVVVADNDAASEGVEVCNKLPSTYPFNVIAFSQKSSGISAVRNAVVQKALSLAPDVVAFLDDDEWPEPQWLAELLRVQEQYDADLVGGPTRPEFPDHADPGLLDNPYYGADLNLPDGSACQLQAGGNFLIKANVLQHYAPEPFHEAFSTSGSEDLAFFTLLNADGHRMYWAAKAAVHEPVPDSRLAPDWLRQRVINIHNSRVRVMQLLQPGVVPSVVRSLKTCALGCMTVLLSLVGALIPSQRHKAQLLRWKFIGKLTAHSGKITQRGETY